MTKSTITRERIQRIIRAIDSEAYDEEEIREWLSSDEIMELARIALAAMDSEPVAVTDDELNAALQLHRLKVDGHSQLSDAFRAGFRYARRTTPQPAPVVPDGLRLALSNAGIAAPESDEMLAATCEKHIQALVTWVKDRKPFQSAPVVPSFEEWLSAANRKPLGWVKDAMREAFDACRAAMLAAAPQSPGSEPATVPGKWIPVSERMPEDRKQVILWDAEIGEVTSGHYSHKTQTFYHCGDAIENEITHWMPPPCAPQEVK
ncbi:DUF551 domain-containing protein [Klebsiella pneumoniae]|uniref:DUF551 domain-containing protein n=2 Tax=Klebsiella pneumoniae TaxID=573 RepID=UPI001D0F7226|nr:DUF551 domain-containing protein [Klebsiella pneumoniae]MCC2901458.1 DUF551 domain-containing protein [Klebsiella pneumoniae]UDV29409.1 DUF551 domain-containing protein [Klebsiella pneumoniae]